MSPELHAFSNRPAAPPDVGEPLRLADLARAARSDWRRLLAIPLVAALVGYAASYAVTPTYTAVTSFVAESRERQPAASGFAGIASQLGVGIGSPTNSPQFFADVLRSHGLLMTVLASKVPAPGRPAGDSVRVIDVIEEPRPDSAARLDKALERLTRQTAASVNPRTGIIELRVSTHYPVTSAEVARVFLRALDEFNLVKRQTQAGQRRRFAEARLHEAQDSLRRAEQGIEDFLLSNRSYRNAPTLQVDFERRQRAINTFQSLVSDYRREFETARVDEVNDTPLISIVDAASVPLRRSAPNRAAAAVGGMMLGALAASALLVLAGLRARRRLAE